MIGEDNGGPSGGPLSLDPDPDSEPENTKSTRKYLPSFKGPYTVFIREKNSKILPIRSAIYLNKTYKSIVEIKRQQNKMRILLSNIEEANSIGADPILSSFHVYIPSTYVEVEGSINFNDVMDLEDLNDLKKYGKGHFNNTLLSDIEIVQVRRLTRKADPNILVLTNTVKVTFAGRILPDYVVIEGLRIKVRAFFNNPMYCNTCQQFNHTAKYCSRKPKCAQCEGSHETNKCDKPEIDKSRCPHCKTQHGTGIRNCPYFAEACESYRQKQERQMQSRYKSAVEGASPKKTADSQPNDNFPSLVNRFSSLEADQTSASTNMDDLGTSDSSTAVKNIRKAASNNPWAKTSQHHNTQSGNKRKRETLSAGLAKPTTSALKTTPKPSPTSPGYQSSQSAESIKAKIMLHVRQSGIDNKWLCIIEAILPAILDVIIPNLKSLIGAIIPVLFGSRP